MPGCSSTARPMIVAPAPRPGPHRRQHRLAVRGVDEGDHLALVGHLRGRGRGNRTPGDGLRNGDGRLVEFDADAGGARQSQRWPPPGRRESDPSGRERHSDPPPTPAWPQPACAGRTVRGHRGAEVDALPNARHDGHAVIADGTRHQNVVAGPGLLRADARAPRAPGRHRRC